MSSLSYWFSSCDPTAALNIRVVRRQQRSPGGNHHQIAANVKVFQKYVKVQDQGHMVKNSGTMWKVLSQGIHMWNMKALPLIVFKL